MPAGGRSELVPLIWLYGAGNERILAPTYRVTTSPGTTATASPWSRCLVARSCSCSTTSRRRPGSRGSRIRKPIDSAIASSCRPSIPASIQQYLAEIGRILDVHLSEVAATIERPSEGALIDLQEVRRVTFHVVASLVLGLLMPIPACRAASFCTGFEELGQGLFSVVHLNLPGLPRSDRPREGMSRCWPGICRANHRLSPRRGARRLHQPDGGAGPRTQLLPDEAIISGADLVFCAAMTPRRQASIDSVVAALRDEPAIYTPARHPGPARPARRRGCAVGGADGPAYLHAVL